MSTRPTPRAVLVLACSAVCAMLLAACGDDEPASTSSATGTLEQTIAATSKLESARLSGRVQLDPDGLVALGGPIVVRASGPVAAPAAGAGPRFDVALGAAIAGQPLSARLRATGRKAFLRLEGHDYALADEGEASSKGAVATSGPAALAGLGLDPAGWLVDPRTAGHATIAGVDTVRIAGRLDVKRLLADVAKLLEDGRLGAGLLTPKLQGQIADAVKSSKVEIWSGADDHILRQLTAFVDFAFDKGSQAPFPGLDGGKINLRLRLDDVDATSFRVDAPKHARPLSKLPADRGLGGVLSQLGIGTGTGVSTSRKDAAALMHCIDAAGDSSAGVMRCASKLAP